MRRALIGAALLASTAGCSLFSSAPPPLTEHSEYDNLQREVKTVVQSVRDSQGPALFAHLRRLLAYDVFAVDQVAELATDPNARLRSNAVWVLGQIRDVRVYRRVLRPSEVSQAFQSGKE